MAANRTLLELTAADWAHTTFVRSTVWEASQAARTLTSRRRQLPHRAWLDSVDTDAARRRLPVLLALHPDRGWVPDFLVPPPTPSARDIEAELAEVRAAPAGRIVADLTRSLHSHPTRARQRTLRPLIDDPDRALDVVVDELHAAWELLVAPFWPVVDELIRDDITYRTHRIARLGVGPAVADVDRSVTWHPDGLVLATREADHIPPRGRGLALLPSAFVWPDLVVIDPPEAPPALAYPARGVGRLWSAPPVPPAGLAGVLGDTRARLLTGLTRPATTTALAGRLGLSPSSVSAQLHRLHDAGLASSYRLGKEVHYRRTPAGDDLLDATSRRRPGTEVDRS
jgi:DNA-binding transcriptional ArsR family regulator